MSHTNFNSGSFGAGALTASLGIAGALVAGMQNAAAAARQREEDKWSMWDRTQLIAALNLTEALIAGERQSARRERTHKRALAVLELEARGLPTVRAAQEMLDRED